MPRGSGTQTSITESKGGEHDKRDADNLGGGGVGRFCWRHKRLTLALAVGLLIVLPLLTGSGGGTFFLNLLGLGIAALVVRRIVQAGNRRQYQLPVQLQPAERQHSTTGRHAMTHDLKR